MRMHHFGVAVIGCLLFGDRAVASSIEQDSEPTVLQRQVFVQLDANGDNVVDRAELTMFVSAHVASLLRSAGANVDETTTLYEEFIAAQIDSLLNASSADGNDTVSLSEMTRLSAAPLIEPLAGTFSQLMPKAPPAGPSAKPWTDRLAKMVQIRQSFLDEQSIGKPAKVSLTTQSVDDESVKDGDPRRVFTIQSAISFRRAKEWKWGRWYSRPVAGYEVNVVSNSPEKDQITHRVGLNGAYVRKKAGSPFSSSVFAVTLDYKTDRGYDAEVWGGTFQYTFFYRQIGVGQFFPRRKPIAIRWQPYFGVVYGDVKHAGVVKAYQEMSDFTHWFAKIAAEAKIGPRWLITPELVRWKGKHIDADGKEQTWQNHYSLTSRWVLAESKGAERASIQLSGTVGRNSPSFEFEKAFEIALGVKF
jgi:hypothetical protein